MTVDEQVQSWLGRLEAARSIYQRVRRRNETLEAAVSGRFPALLPGIETLDPSLGSILSTEQVDINLMLRTSNYFTALAYDEFPTIRFARPATMQTSVTADAERFLQNFMDDMGATYACRRAMRSSMTRGPFIIWINLGQGVPTAESSYTTKLAAAELALRAMQGEEVHPGVGTDNQALQEAVDALLSDEAMRLTMPESGAANLSKLFEEAAKASEKELNGSHPINGGKARVWYQHLPYGTWCLVDSSATELSRITWAARRVVMTREEFMGEPAFTDAAKAEIKPIPPARITGHVTDQPPHIAGPNAAEGDLYELWNIFDKQKWEQHFVSKGYEKFVEKDSAYPYLNEYGRPVFEDFFPMVVRTPIEDIREEPEAVMGIPVLLPGWGPQLELIKCHSAWLAGTKRSGRTFVSAQALDEKIKTDLASGVDGVIVEPPPGYSLAQHGPLLTMLNVGQSPPDYLMASEHLKADFAILVGIELGVLTGQPVADTLGQEQISLRGSTTTQGDMVRCYESAFAELATKTAALVRTFIPDEVIQSYTINQDAQQVRQALLSLQTSKITVRFASGTRAEDSVRLKQLMDYIALLNTLRNPITGTPEFDVKQPVIRFAKEMDMDPPVPWLPTANDFKMAQLLMGGAPMGGQTDTGNGAPGGGQSDGRAAGGSRGPPAVPGRQSRHQQPPDHGDLAGPQMRHKSAVS